MKNILSFRILSWLIIPIFLVITLQFFNSNFKLLKFPAQDFEVFYLAGKQALNGQNPYLEIGKDIVRNPPPAIPIFMLLALFPILISQTIWFISSLVGFLIGSYLLFKILKNEHKSKLSLTNNWKIWLLYLSLVFSFFPFRYNLGSGQVNNFLFLFLVLAFYFIKQGNYFFSGLSLTFGIILKITPVLILFPLMIMKEYRVIKWTIFNLVLIFLITLSLVGFKTYQNYLTIPNSFFNFGLSVYGNQSIVGFLARISSAYQLNQFIYILALISALIILLRFIKNTDDINSLSIWNIAILYMLIFAPFTWQYHFVIAIFPLITTSYLLYKTKSSSILYFLIFLSYLLIGWNTKNPTNFINLGLLGSVVLSHILWGSILLLFLNYKIIMKLTSK